MSLKPPPPPTPPEPPFEPRIRARGAGRSRAGFLPEPGAGEQEFDALTDLFLGEMGNRARGFNQAADARLDATPDRPRLRLRRDTDDDLSIPLPALAAPSSDFDSAADLRLPDDPFSRGVEIPAPLDQTPAIPALPVATEPIVECIILGHLPVLGSAWATQYVREVAQAARRPVAVLRVQAGYASVEIVGAFNDDARRVPETCASVDAAVRAAQTVTDRWIVRCDPAEEPAIAARPAVRVITLLTGGDEAARVGAYASIKSLAEFMSPPSEAEPGPLVRLAIMGAHDDAARAAGSKVAETVKAFLGRNIEQVVCASRIGSSRPPLLLFSGPVDGEPGRVLDLLDRRAAARSSQVDLDSAAPDLPAAIADTPLRESPTSAPVSRQVLVPETTPRETVQPIDDQAAPEPIAFPQEPTQAPEPARPSILVLETQPEPSEDHAPIDPVPQTETAARPEPTPVVEIKTPPPSAAPAVSPRFSTPEPPSPAAGYQAQPGPSLASHLPGLRPLPVLCPYAKSVELAIDSSAALHLLVHAEDEASDESVLAALFVASSWAEAHATLLSLAIGAPLGSEGRPVLHLFTGRPKHSRRLLDTGVRIHLLASVAVGDRSAWFCTDLN